ncbi:MAG: hypothetical protein EOP52_03680 [Sphingobacteriales bacterium]|nr:MAG: hypothetical protein EOP52_03680 [Sphingobacteriales bacterium]
MSIGRRLVPVFAILLAGILLRLIRTGYGLEWTGLQRVSYLILGALLLTLLGNGLLRLFKKP